MVVGGPEERQSELYTVLNGLRIYCDHDLSTHALLQRSSCRSRHDADRSPECRRTTKVVSCMTMVVMSARSDMTRLRGEDNPDNRPPIKNEANVVIKDMKAYGC